MTERIDEGQITGAVDAISLEKADKILEQMKTCICRIQAGKKMGTGFFCKIIYSMIILKIYIKRNQYIFFIIQKMEIYLYHTDMEYKKIMNIILNIYVIQIFVHLVHQY